MVLVGVGVDVAGLSHHDGGVDVDGVGRVLDGGGDAGTEDLLHSHDVAFGAVADEHLAVFDDAVVQFVGDLLTEGSHALFGAVARVSVLGAQFGGRADEAREDVRGDGPGGVPDAQGDDAGGHFGVLLQVGVAAAADFGEELCGVVDTA